VVDLSQTTEEEEKERTRRKWEDRLKQRQVGQAESAKTFTHVENVC
jgi:hypothetical protein